jgi:AhpD family alkylhydroperoxidase
MKFDERTIRLIAVGASVAANCQPCLVINTTKARENGADDQMIAEAIEIGKMVRAGAASKMDKFAASLNQAITQTAGSSSEACGCKPTLI